MQNDTVHSHHKCSPATWRPSWPTTRPANSSRVPTASCASALITCSPQGTWYSDTSTGFSAITPLVWPAGSSPTRQGEKRWMSHAFVKMDSWSEWGWYSKDDNDWPYKLLFFQSSQWGECLCSNRQRWPCPSWWNRTLIYRFNCDSSVSHLLFRLLEQFEARYSVQDKDYLLKERVTS